MLEAESEIEGGASPRVAPFADTRDAGALLQRAGFALPVADSDTITVTLARRAGPDARPAGDGRGQRACRAPADAHASRGFRHGGGALRVPVRRRGGAHPATFEILFLTGWAPAPGQQQPLRPGSAAARLADALDAEERSAGERAGPGKS